jgi:hypothetical protein
MSALTAGNRSSERRVPSGELPGERQFRIVTAQLNEILMSIFSVSYGREFLLLELDRRLICEFNPNFGLELEPRVSTAADPRIVARAAAALRRIPADPVARTRTRFSQQPGDGTLLHL